MYKRDMGYTDTLTHSSYIFEAVLFDFCIKTERDHGYPWGKLSQEVESASLKTRTGSGAYLSN